MRVVGALLVCSVISLWAAAVAVGKGTLPKGTAYAAEVRVTVDYSGDFIANSSTEEDCTDADGNTIKQTSGSHEEEKVARTLLFKHITVPVVPASKLGAAAPRLALQPQITDPGKTTSDHSTYALSGTQVTDNNPCPQTISNYECDGVLTNIGQITGFMTSNDYGFGPTTFELPATSPIVVSDPEGCSALSWNNVAESLEGDAGRADLRWEQVQLHSDLRQRLYSLLNKREVDFTQEVGPAVPCPPLEFPTISCSQTVTGSAKVKIKRLFLYRTKKSYPK